MNALDLNAEDLWTFFSIDSDIKITIDADWLVILRGLEVLWHIWIEVVLTGEAAKGRNRAVQRKADTDRRLNRLRIHDRK